jgi:hypothetical protein
MHTSNKHACMQRHIQTYIHTYMHTCTHTNKHTCIHWHIQTYIHPGKWTHSSTEGAAHKFAFVISKTIWTLSALWSWRTMTGLTHGWRPVCHSVLEIMCVWVMELKIIKIPGHIVVCVCAEVCDGAWPYSWTWHQQWQWLQLWQWIFQDLDSDSQHFLQLALSVNVTVAGTVTILWQWLFHKTSTVTVSLWQWQWQCQCNSVLMPPESTSTQSLCPNTDL